MKSRIKIICSGIVQGIGYRPFVYRLAKKFNLKGYVRNQGDAGVVIIAEGLKSDLFSFINSLEKDKPYLTKYEGFQIFWESFLGEYDKFVIDKSSEKKASGISYLPPDISICDDCIRDIANPNDSRFNYAFSSCAICGPRYTTITRLPYDRPNTTMIDFPLCLSCKSEYEDPLDRRYHAQTTCCTICGPQFQLFNSKTKERVIVKKDIFKYVAQLIENDFIVAIKGIGGTHLACSATNDNTILKLRTRKGKRKHKPFAIISKSIHDIKKYAEISPLEEDLLTNYRKPILLLKKKQPFILSRWIAPDLFNIGVMLPYSGIHSLILKSISDPAIILTSANPSNVPMYIDNEGILMNASNLADFVLLHNRVIYQRADDSVIRLTNDHPVLIRRSRGWVPEPITLPFSINNTVSLGVGPLLASSATLTFKNKSFPTQYIGDVDTLETLDFLESSIRHLAFLLDINSFNTIGCDLHPRFLSTHLAKKYSNEFNATLYEIQHHFAHAVALMADNQLHSNEEILAIVADGIGYGDDGKIWGGEILHCSFTDYKRIGHLEEQMMPGGDRATIYPIRMLAGILTKKLSLDEIQELLSLTYLNAFPGGINEIHVLVKQLEKKLNTYQTTSTGRILSAISSLLNICQERTYEGEPAITLESLAIKGNSNKIKLTIPPAELGIINTTEFVYQALKEYQKGTNPADIALAVHYELANQFSDVAITYAKSHNLTKIGFTGGVAYNNLITTQIAKKVKEANLEFLYNRSLPCGDGGISIGQSIAAALKNKQ